MKLKEIIRKSITFLKRDDILENMDSGTLTDEQNEVVKLLLFCVNSAEDELARNYFPLKYTEEVEPKEGEVLFSSLSKRPSRIYNIFRDDEPIHFQLFPTHVVIRGKGKVRIEYEYVPSKSGGMDDDSIYTNTCVGENLIASGALSEYFLICGEIELSEYWESRYRTLIEGASKIYKFSRYIPPRRWL